MILLIDSVVLLIFILVLLHAHCYRLVLKWPVQQKNVAWYIVFVSIDISKKHCCFEAFTGTSGIYSCHFVALYPR